MDKLKMLVLASVAAMILMAFGGAGVASGTTLDGGFGSLGKEATIEASLSGGTMTLETLAGTVLNTCKGSTIKAKTKNNGEAATVEAQIEELTWIECTHTTDNIQLGKLEISNISGSHNGTVSVNGLNVTILSVFGTCEYGSSNSLDIGSVTSGVPAVISINTILPKLTGNAACPSEARWTASYAVTNPAGLTVTP